MSILEIMLLGYMVNIAAFLIIVILAGLLSLFTTTDSKTLSLLKESLENNRRAKALCKEENISITTQDDFVAFIPFTGIVRLVSFLVNTVIMGVPLYLVNRLNRNTLILLDRLNNQA